MSIPLLSKSMILSKSTGNVDFYVLLKKMHASNTWSQHEIPEDKLLVQYIRYFQGSETEVVNRLESF